VGVKSGVPFISIIGDQKIDYLICCLGRSIHQSLALVLLKLQKLAACTSKVRKRISIYKLLVLSTTVRALFYFQIQFLVGSGILCNNNVSSS